MPIAGGIDIHPKQITFDYLDLVTGEVQRGQIVPVDRAHLRAWLGGSPGARCGVCVRGVHRVAVCGRDWPGPESGRIWPSLLATRRRGAARSGQD